MPKRHISRLALCALLFCSCKPKPASTGEEKPAGEPGAATAPLPEKKPPPSDPLAQFHTSLELDSSGAFADRLASSGHGKDRPAPPALRSLVIGMDPARFEMTTAVEEREGWLTYVWFLPAFTVKGSPQEAVSKMGKVLASLAFQPDEPQENRWGEMEHHFRKTVQGVSHHIWITGPSPHTGGTEERSSGTLSYEVSSPTKLPEPTVERMIEVYPGMLCTQIPEELLTLAEPRHFTRISCGGTWDAHYDFSVTLQKEPGASDEQDLLALASKLGFTSFKDEPGNEILENKKKMGAFFYVTTDDDGRVTFRIQPGQ